MLVCRNAEWSGTVRSGRMRDERVNGWKGLGLR